VHLGRVGIDKGFREQLLPDFNGGGKRRAQEFGRLLDNKAELDRLLGAWRFSAEGKDLANKIPGTYRGGANLPEFIDYRGIVSEFVDGDLGKAHDCREYIVEIMGNASGQGADGLQLLLLLEFAFKPVLKHKERVEQRKRLITGDYLVPTRRVDQAGSE